MSHANLLTNEDNFLSIKRRKVNKHDSSSGALKGMVGHQKLMTDLRENDKSLKCFCKYALNDCIDKSEGCHIMYSYDLVKKKMGQIYQHLFYSLFFIRTSALLKL